MMPRLRTCGEGVRETLSNDRVKLSAAGVRDLGPVIRRFDLAELSWR